MTRVSSFIYAQEQLNEHTSNGPRIHLINPMHIFMPVFIPSQFSFVIGVGIIDIDTSVEHTIRFKFYGPDSGLPAIVDSGETVKVPSQPNPNNLPVELLGLFMGMDLRNVILNTNGVYKTEVYVDGILLGEYPVNVKGLN